MLSKLKLDLDELTVDSFDTSPGEAENGTVFGEQCTCETVCTCPGCDTCDISCYSCAVTCAATCPNTCDNFSCRCIQDTQDTCTTARYTYCNGQQCL